MYDSNKNKDVLIAYLPSYKDFRTLLDEHWYRIPTTSKTIPNMVKNGSLKLLALYQPKIFNDDAFAVRWYGIVKDIKVVKRSQLFKDEPKNPKSDYDYYKIEIEKLLRLPASIRSLRHRRIIFITTTIKRFEKAREINDLFLESPLEEQMWEEFKKCSIFTERQYIETVNKRNYILDFAIFCRDRKLAIECDGDTYHLSNESVKKDKKRDNELENRGWNVFRYTTEDINERFDDCIYQVKDTINRYGGLENPEDNSRFHYFPKDLGNSLFDNTDGI
ncbi:MAG: hypothetical protein HW421_717 [Ignavibacteria bacterium]|nr:hypothetical protein [Ignavibacteria bacterium]